MKKRAWAQPVPTNEAHRRAGGRRRYNAERQAQAAARQARVLDLLEHYGMRRGVFARIARQLGVHRSTVLRDAKYPTALLDALLNGKMQ